MTKRLIEEELKIISPRSLNRRFKFITNDTLKSNVSNTFAYIVFLYSLSETDTLPNFLKTQIYKNTIIQTVSIVESIITWKLLDLVKIGDKRQKDFQSRKKEYDFKSIKKVYTPKNDYEIFVCFRIPKVQIIEEDTHLIEINRAALRSNLFDIKLFNKAEKLRKTRNKIHLAGLKQIDDKYREKDVDNLFKISGEIIERIEKQ